MNLIIDLGNTSKKFALFEGGVQLHYFVYPEIDIQKLQLDLDPYSKKIKQIILASVINHTDNFVDWLKSLANLIILDHETLIPIRNHYKSPNSLGMDRLACAIGAYTMSKRKAVLAIDAGTCIKFEFVDEAGNYHGGAISPGIYLRYQSLNTFTDKLPLVNNMNSAKLIGDDTFSSISSGVLNGTIAEVDGIIDRYRQLYSNLNVFLSGGDSNIFAKNLKNSIFAVDNLVLSGLNEILNFNDRSK